MPGRRSITTFSQSSTSTPRVPPTSPSGRMKMLRWALWGRELQRERRSRSISIGIRRKLGVRAERTCSPPRCRLVAIRLTSYQPWTTCDFAWRTWGRKSVAELFPEGIRLHQADASQRPILHAGANQAHRHQRSHRRAFPGVVGTTVAGRGAAIVAASGSDQCHQCKAFGHYRSDCPQVTKTNGSESKPKKDKKGRSGDPSPKWCSCHRTNPHSDSPCHRK